MRRLGIAALCLTAACAPTTFHGHLRAGEWQLAARAFEESADLQYDAWALRRAAYLHAHPDSVTWNPGRSAYLLELARQRRPASAADARLEAILRTYAAELESHARRVAQLEAVVDSLTAITVQLEAERSRLEAALVAQTEERDSTQRQLLRVEQDLRARDAEVFALRSELDRLKAIDLAPPRASPR